MTGIEEKQLYVSGESARLWLRLCRDPHYKNYRRSRLLIQRNAQRIAQRIEKIIPRTSDRLAVISLGAGQGDKDLLLLHALRRGGRDLVYRPVDSSRFLLRLAVRAARRARFPTRPLQADLMEPSTVRKLTGAGPRIFLILGNTLGGLDPLRMAKTLKRLLRPGNFLLVDGEIIAGAETLAGYDHPANRAFAWGPLKALGWSEKDGRLRFRLRKDRRRQGLTYVEKYFQRVQGPRIRMSPSYKYSPKTFREIVEKLSASHTIQEFFSADRRLLMILAQRV